MQNCVRELKPSCLQGCVPSGGCGSDPQCFGSPAPPATLISHPVFAKPPVCSGSLPLSHKDPVTTLLDAPGPSPHFKVLDIVPSAGCLLPAGVPYS